MPPAAAGAALSIAAREASELEAEPGAGAGDAGVARRQIGVRDVIEEPRHIDAWGHRVAELGALAEQNPRTEQLSARRLGGAGQRRGVMHRTAEAAIGEDAVTRLEQVLDQGDAPGQPEIAVAGSAVGIDVGADMRSRRPDD